MPHARPRLRLLVVSALAVAFALPAVAEAAVPASSAPPVVTGTQRDGQKLSGSNGTWTGTTPMTFNKRWQRCDEMGENCVEIPNESGTTYTLTSADVGQTIRLAVTAINAEGRTTQQSLPTDLILAKQPPTNHVLPAITGTTRDTQVLTTTNGDWTGVATISYTRKWLRCEPGAPATECTPLASGGQTYTLTSADVDMTMRVQVTATNPDGTFVVTSAETARIIPTPPVNTVRPSTSGTARVGQSFTLVNVGSWAGTTPMTYERQWQRCNSSGSTCADIAGATGTTYTLTTDDIGSTIRVGVIAENAAGLSAFAYSTITSVVGPKQPPVNTVLPGITGSFVDGTILTGGNGTWTGIAPLNLTRRWQRCEADGTGCVDQTATGTTYTLANADVGKTIRVVVTGTNVDGTSTVNSAVTPVIQPAPATATTLPTVTGSAREGQVLTATIGKWAGTPTVTTALVWERCTSGTCSPISGETALTYRLQPADVGSTFRVAVTGTNAAGPRTAYSAQTVTVAEGAPVNTGLPEISGPLPFDGQTYSSTIGDWVGTDPIQYRLQWLRCNNTGASCTLITGATGSTYDLTSADVGKTVRLEVSAANAYGTAKAQSAASPLIVATPPSPTAAPVLSGDFTDGGTLTTSTGTWSGTTPIALAYQWQRCPALTGTCNDIPAATTTSLKLTNADAGAYVRVRVSATGPGGADVSYSAHSPLIADSPPTNTIAPLISGRTMEFETLTVAPGTWTGTPTISYTYQWQRCDSAGAACAAIPGATGSSRVLDAADRGSTLRVVVTASNDAAPVSVTSAASTVVEVAPPKAVIPPSVSPIAGLKDGVIVTSTDGAWGGSEPRTVSYRWQRCKLPVTATNCTDIAGATDRTYRVQNADVGMGLRSIVTATNGAGNLGQTSNVTGAVGTNPPVSTVAPTVTGVAQDGRVLGVDVGEWNGVVPFTTTYQWWRCDAAGNNCGPVPGATQSTFELSPTDIDLTIRVEVFQTNVGGVGARMSDPSAVVVPAPPQNAVPPRATGPAAVGRELTAEVGTWRGTPGIDYFFQWQRCPTTDTCVDIPGATAVTYRLTEDDNGLGVRVVVTGRNDVGQAAAVSMTTAEVSDKPPVPVDEPRITAAGLIASGSIIEVDSGDWGGAEPITYTYAWERCDAAGNNCLAISGATEPQYLLTDDDVGKRIVAVVSATNVVATNRADTEPTPVVLPQPPTNVVAPSITSKEGFRDGIKVSSSTGTWEGAEPLVLSSLWLRCNADGLECVPIPGANQSTYTLTSDDVDTRLRLRVTAVNPTAEVTRDSAPSDVVTPAAPIAASRPAIVAVDGKPTVGGRLRATPGDWGGTKPMNLAYQWQRCIGTSLAACDDIPGATGDDYKLGEGDVGRRVRVIVVATNAAGTVKTDSTPTTAVPAIAPDTLGNPTVNGGPARAGVQLSADPGPWTGTAPITIGYQWERCAQANAPTCAKISGATRNTYVLDDLDVGKHVRVSVTAQNSAGRVTRNSAATDQVDGNVPSNVLPPVATAKGLRVGGTLTASTGKWAGTNPMKYEYRWQRCDVRGRNCTDLPDGGDKMTYTLKTGDLNGAALAAPVRVLVMAVNSAGTAEASSAPLGVVVPDPEPKVRPKKKKKSAKAAVAAALKSVRLGSDGRLHVTLTCPKAAAGTCGAVGRVSIGGVKVNLKVAKIARGKSLTKRYKLSAAARRALLKAKMRVSARIAAPANPKGGVVSKARVGKAKPKAKKKPKSKRKKKKSKRKSKKRKSKKKKTSAAKRRSTRRATEPTSPGAQSAPSARP